MSQENPSIEIGATSKEMMRWIEEIVSFGIRRPGYPADLRTEDYIAERFREFGLRRVCKERVPVNCWTPEATVFSMGGSPVCCTAVPYTQWTGADGVEAEMVFVGEGTVEDFEGTDISGRIVVVDGRFADFSTGELKKKAGAIYDPAGDIPDGILHQANWLITNFPSYYEAGKRGAAAYVGLLVDSPIDGASYYVPYDGFLKRLPAVWVAREDADKVRGRAKKGETAFLKTLGKTAEADSHNVIGWVEGRSTETILLTCHHDAPFASAVEDASGLSLLLALAAEFGDRHGELERNLLFVASSGHFHGGIGNRCFVAEHREDWVPNIVAALGMEHIAEEAEPDGSGGYRLTGRAEVRVIFTDTDTVLSKLAAEGIEKWKLDRTMVVPPYLFGPEPPCDSAPFFTAGIPSACLISGPLYLFDEFDTPDKVRERDLIPAASLFAELVTRLDRIPRQDLERGLARKRDDPPAPPPHWFLPPEVFPGTSG